MKKFLKIGIYFCFALSGYSQNLNALCQAKKLSTILELTYFISIPNDAINAKNLN